MTKSNSTLDDGMFAHLHGDIDYAYDTLVEYFGSELVDKNVAVVVELAKVDAMKNIAQALNKLAENARTDHPLQNETFDGMVHAITNLAEQMDAIGIEMYKSRTE